MPFTTYTRTVATTLVAMTSLVAFAQTGATKTQTVILAVNGENFILRTKATTVAELLQEQQALLSAPQTVLNGPLLPSADPTTPITEGLQIAMLPKTTPVSASKKALAPIKVVKATETQKAANRGTLSSRSALGNLSRYEGKRVLTLTATGYGPGENGPWGNRTKLGTRVRYGVVAVDPRVIKLGTRLYVEGYGECVAEDVGGAIKGMRIDLAFNSDRVANQYGRRRVRVVILD